MISVDAYPYTIQRSGLYNPGTGGPVSSGTPRVSTPAANPVNEPSDRFESTADQNVQGIPGLYSFSPDPRIFFNNSAGSSDDASRSASRENDDESSNTAGAEEKAADGSDLNEEERAQLDDLKARDREVRQHEQAHISVGGSYAGAASYSYEKGPDGQSYAVGGEVSIDTSTERDPEATIAKMRIVKAAAMAPANPSSQDMAVAAAATQQEFEAQQQLRRQQTEGNNPSGTGAALNEPATGTQETGDGSSPTQDDNRIPTGMATSGNASADPVRSAYSTPSARLPRVIDFVA